MGVLGVVLMLFVAYLFSDNRAAIRWRTVAWGIALQFIFAVFILKVPIGQQALRVVAQSVTAVIEFSSAGSSFVFGHLANDPEYFVFAFKVLPIVIFISSLFAVLYHLGVMQRVVFLMALIMNRLMGVSGSESLAAAGNVFLGQTETPIIVAPYISQMTRSELMALMTGGMATVSGAILGGYIALGINAEFLIAASVLAALASLVMAKMIVPETDVSKTGDTVMISVERRDANVIDAVARGAGKGVILAINIAAMLIAFVSLIALLNSAFSFLGETFGLQESLGVRLSMQWVLGCALAPVALIMGVPWVDSFVVGQLIGVKIVLNEFVAYTQMVEVHGALQAKSELIATYALCGFANFSSIGIQIGGIGGLAPERRSDLAKLGMRALLAGSLASFMTAALAGMLT